jgi:hypothetical protein
MKNSTTSVALVQAIPSAMIGFNTPRSTYDRGAQQQQGEDGHIDLGADDVVRLFRVFAHGVCPQCLLIR